MKEINQLPASGGVLYNSNFAAQDADGVTSRVSALQLAAFIGTQLGGTILLTPRETPALNRAAIQLAFDDCFAAGGGTVMLMGEFPVDDRVTINSNTTIDCIAGASIKLADGANEFVLTIAAGARDVKIRNIRINGNKANNPSGASGIQNEDSTATRVLIENVYVHDCKLYGMRLSGSVFKVTGCNAIDNDNSGITGDLLTYFGFTNNYATRNIHHGIGCIGVCNYGVISDNTAEDNGAPSIGADNFTGYGAGISHIVWDSNVSRKGNNNGVHVGGSYITFTNNIIEDANFYGLIARNADASPMPGFVAHGNTIRGSGSNAGNSGVWLGNLVDFTWGPNTVIDSYAHGLLVQEGCTKGSITGGVYSNNGGGAASGSGIRLQTGCSKITISGAQMAANASSGLRLADSTDILVTGCQAVDNPAPFVTTGATTCQVKSNDFPGTPSLVAGTVTYWSDTPNGGTVNLASAAAPALPAYTDYFRVTGTTNITTITGGWFERRITLRFTDALTMVTGGNLVIGGGTYTSASNSTLTLVYDGTTWYETSRMTP